MFLGTGNISNTETKKLNILISDIGTQHPENVLGIMHLSPSRQIFVKASVLDIVTDDMDGILLVLLEQFSLKALCAHVCRCSAPRMQTLREKTEGRANSLGWRRVEVDDPGRKRGVKRKEHKQ